MLYSIGKDSSVMLHLARKAFFPGKPPFPLFHIDTGWKFREMIAFRDKTARAGSRSSCPHQRGGEGVRHQSDHFGLGIAYRGYEDRGLEAGARPIRFRCGVRRSAA
jgi:sulfate adenylyltransferase subunit 2